MLDKTQKLAGKTAIVTGGSRGIGASIVRLLVQEGCSVLSISREKVSNSTVPDQVIQHAIDLTIRPEQGNIGDAVMAVAIEHFKNIDILINCAGIGLTMRAEKSTDEDFAQILALNVAAVQSLSSSFMKATKKAGRPGVILNVSSLLAHQAMRGSALYGASKAAVEHLTKVHALEWARHKIRVNAIAPGWFDTLMTHDLLNGPAGALLAQKNPMSRFGHIASFGESEQQQGDLDGAVLFLVSDASAYVTGIVLPVDGGQHLTS